MQENQAKSSKYKITTEIFILTALIIASYFVGMHRMQHYHHKQYFYQANFAPAVMLACGRGFVEVEQTKQPAAMSNFLAVRTKALDCQALPKKLITAPFNLYQGVERYLLLSAGVIWKFTGVSWPKLYILNAILFVLTILGTYALLRLGCGIIIALLLSVTFLSANFYYGMLPQIRDFSVAPFIIFYLFILGSLIKFPYNTWRTMGLALFAGVVLGIGLGFRLDLLIYTPIFILVLLFFSSAGITNKLFAKCVAIAIYILTITVLGYPIFKALGSNNLFHNALQGFATLRTFKLGIVPSPLYGYHYKYTDYFIQYLITSYYNHVLHVPTSKLLLEDTALSAKIGSMYFWHFVLTFPADMIMRALASAYNILSYPYVLLVNRLFASDLAVSIAKYWAIASTIFAILIICKISLRMALITLFLVLFLTGYPAIQYGHRHIFYLAIVPMWLAGLLIQSLYNVIFAYKQEYDVSQIQWRRIIIFSVSCIMLFFLILGSAIAYQNYSLTKLFVKYEHAKLKSLPIVKAVKHDEYTFLQLPDFTTGGTVGSGVGYGILAVKFNQRLCKLNPLFLRVKYHTAASAEKYPALYNYNNLTHTVSVNASGITKIFFPVYRESGGHFIGIELPNEEKKCFISANKVVDVSQFPMEIIVKLPDNWRKLIKHQTIGERSFFEIELPKTLYVFPANIQLPKTVWQQKLQTMKLQRHTTIFRVHGDKYVIKGRPKSRFDNIASFASKIITSAELAKANYYLLAEGELYQGGFRLGFSRNKHFLPDAIIGVRQHRKFKLAIKIIKPGVYTPTLANNLVHLGENNFIISKIGWLKTTK